MRFPAWLIPRRVIPRRALQTHEEEPSPSPPSSSSTGNYPKLSPKECGFPQSPCRVLFRVALTGDLLSIIQVGGVRMNLQTSETSLRYVSSPNLCSGNSLQCRFLPSPRTGPNPQLSADAVFGEPSQAVSWNAFPSKVNVPVSPAKLLQLEMGSMLTCKQFFRGDRRPVALICSPHTPHAEGEYPCLLPP